MQIWFAECDWPETIQITGMCAVRIPSVLYSVMGRFETSISHEAVWLPSNGSLHSTPKLCSIYFLLSVCRSASATSGINLCELFFSENRNKKRLTLRIAFTALFLYLFLFFFVSATDMKHTHMWITHAHRHMHDVHCTHIQFLLRLQFGMCSS